MCSVETDPPQIFAGVWGISGFPPGSSLWFLIELFFFSSSLLTPPSSPSASLSYSALSTDMNFYKSVSVGGRGDSQSMCCTHVSTCTIISCFYLPHFPDSQPSQGRFKLLQTLYRMHFVNLVNLCNQCVSSFHGDSVWNAPCSNT